MKKNSSERVWRARAVTRRRQHFEDNPDSVWTSCSTSPSDKKLERQFRQSQKMEAVGQLAGGVAHDFNNILAVIQMQADLVKTDGNLSPAQLEFAEEIGAAAQRAAALTRQLLLFSRKEALQLRDLDLNESINDMTKMLRRNARRRHADAVQIRDATAVRPRRRGHDGPSADESRRSTPATPCPRAGGLSSKLPPWNLMKLPPPIRRKSGPVPSSA